MHMPSEGQIAGHPLQNTMVNEIVVSPDATVAFTVQKFCVVVYGDRRDTLLEISSMFREESSSIFLISQTSSNNLVNGPLIRFSCYMKFRVETVLLKMSSLKCLRHQLSPFLKRNQVYPDSFLYIFSPNLNLIHFGVRKMHFLTVFEF